MKIFYSNQFIKRYKKIPAKIQKQIEKKITTFKDLPYHPLLNNHTLTGKWTGYCSINISGDWRAIYHNNDNDIVIFDTIDTHSNLYKKH
ncbi:type II toxin-antitoxin system mRNA interferase toxin, RelE/StbE family [Patescibacteria group bacterium]|nr:type II toxin-antitoxin system mRNA interferase toxin, RelE/StbE family [Patescibacteria group bacterium]